MARAVNGKCVMRENGSRPVTWPACATNPGASPPSVFPPSADFAFEQNEQRVRRIAFVQENVAGREAEFLRARREPLQLILAKIRENLDLPQRGFQGLFFGGVRRRHDTLLKY